MLDDLGVRQSVTKLGLRFLCQSPNVMLSCPPKEEQIIPSSSV